MSQHNDPSSVSPSQVERVRNRIAPEATLGRGVQTLLAEMPAPSALEVSRVRAQIRASRAVEHRSGRLVRGLMFGLPVMATAVLAWVQLQPPQPTSGQSELVGESLLEPLDEVALEYGGNGNAVWEDKVVRIDWDYGSITGDVEHGQGIRMSVHTREGVVKVVGTRFTVVRDALGSNISVEHGAVEVTCDGGPNATVTDGESHRCPPVSPGQWTSSVDGLLAATADAETVHTAISRGLKYAEVDSPVRGELLARRVQLHLREGELKQAASIAQKYLDEGFRMRAHQLRPVAATLPEATLPEATLPEATPSKSVLSEPVLPTGTLALPESSPNPPPSESP